ncbi:DNA (cytosine-5-)-methyltransferase [Pseudoduganella sp. FT93W]|uniref:Cytosine-specific methyltransferase n=2 Tax=Duganella fentianensis TaxID=2692177 RepID=A0A845I3R4_9BURK|nr:DNA (cytosine-5-)-methyltransferase [Duganella fentianensis]
MNLSKADYIRSKRERMGLTQQQFATLLLLKENGERTVGGWERGEHQPSPRKWEDIQALPEGAPYRAVENDPEFRFIDLFAGIGGIRIPFQELRGKCVFTSEWDKFAKKTYAANFGEMPEGDITKISAQSIPAHDVLLGGFPCQAFSQAGLKKGFLDTRGTMFFEIQKILAHHRPKAFLLENVKQLRGHNGGRTLAQILEILEGKHENEIPDEVPLSAEAREALGNRLNYQVFTRVLRARDFGRPQNRERVFIVGFDRDYYGAGTDFSTIFSWPEPTGVPTRLGDILENSAQLAPHYTISDKLWNGHERRKREHTEKGNGFGYSLFTKESPYTSTLSARYYKDGSEILICQKELGKNPRKLTPRECARLQGFDEKFIVDAVSESQAYKQFGNSVTVPVIRAIAEELRAAMVAGERARQR